MTSSRPADEQTKPSIIACRFPVAHAGRASWTALWGRRTSLLRRVPWQPVVLTATPLASLLTVVLYLQLHPARWAWTAATFVAIYVSARLWPAASRVLPAAAGRLSRRPSTPRTAVQAIGHGTGDDHQ